MSKELMKTRYLCIEDFPQWSAFKIEKGDILHKEGIHYRGGNTGRAINENEIDLYPAIFRPLKWWEFRDEKELSQVQYVKSTITERVYKVGEICHTDEVIIISDGGIIGLSLSEPATLEEYESFTKK